MTKRLKISIGPSRDQMVIAHVNNSAKPTIINSEYFVGRVLIKIRDFDGITPDGSPPIRDHVYFDGRSRKFDIQIEGRFKSREGVPLYSGEEVHFGSDFDHIVDFPKSAFNAGMRVARWIDPNVFYDLSPPSQRPFIMSPYLACMNTLCAWPCPSRLADALVCLRQSDRDEDHTPDARADDMVPMEQVDEAERGATAGKKKIARHTRRYWRFIGLKGDGGRIDAFIEKNAHLLAPPPTELASEPAADGDAEDDDDDALSCRAPSSHATYATAFEGVLDSLAPLSSAASSYRFAPRIFPRHQISFGAGMRDMYQDAEIEANEREGEARAQQMIDMMGEDESMPPNVPPPAPLSLPSPPPLTAGLENDEATKKGSKVKHSLKKLKTAFKKMTPTKHSAPSTSSTTPPTASSALSPKQKLYSTALHGKPKRGETTPLRGTVSRAASRTLPGSSFIPTLRTESRSSETVKLLGRRSTFITRPLSHHPPASSPSGLQAPGNKFRSTSLDQTRPRPPAVPLLSQSQLSTETSLHTISQGPEECYEAGPGGQAKEGRLSSPSTERSQSHSDVTSSVQTSPVASEQLPLKGSVEPPRLKVLLNGSPSAERSGPGTSETWPPHLVARTSPEALGIHEGFQTTASPTGITSESDTPTRASLTPALTPLSMTPELTNSSAGSDQPSQEMLPLRGTADDEMPTGAGEKRPSQAEIDDAPELEDVESGDLMFANMLKISRQRGRKEGSEALSVVGAPDGRGGLDDEGQGKEEKRRMETEEDERRRVAKEVKEVEELLGAWRFEDPNTDILEDNTFVFLNKSINVQKRRKYFSEGNGKYRKSFTYDPDVVYATSFFSPFMDFNTFDLSIGPVKINVAKVFGSMPVRYTLRSTRIDRTKSKKGEGEGAQSGEEEEIFVTIAFELVDVDDE